MQDLAIAPDFHAQITLAFGDDWNREVIQSLSKEWISGSFDSFPQVEVIPSADISGANGAFADATNTIYIAKDFLIANTANTQAVTEVLREETGHYIDAQINEFDTSGDEGALFAALMRGDTLSQAKILDFKNQDDTASVTIDGQTIAIEQSSFDYWFVRASNANTGSSFSTFNFGSNTRSDGKQGFSVLQDLLC